MLSAYRDSAGVLTIGVGHTAAAGAPKATRLMHDTLAPLVHKRFEESERPGQRSRRLIESRAVDWKDGAEGSTLDARELKAVKTGRGAMQASNMC